MYGLSFRSPSSFLLFCSDSQYSNSSMANESLPSTSPRRRSDEQTYQLGFACHCDSLYLDPLHRSLAYSRQRARMGRLDNSRILHSITPFYGYPADQFVPSTPSNSTLSIVLTLRHQVTFTGLGQDIWTVPFDDITMMFKVCTVLLGCRRQYRHLTLDNSISTSTSTFTKLSSCLRRSPSSFYTSGSSQRRSLRDSHTSAGLSLQHS